MTIFKKYKFFILILIPLMLATYVKASTYLDVGDDVYDILQRLEAEGVIQSALLNTKPLSRKEVVRLIKEAETNAEDRSPFIRSLVQNLKVQFEDEVDDTRYVKPLDKVRVTYINGDTLPSELNYNNDGDDYDDGSNFRLETISRAELGWFSLFINPELKYSDDDTDVIMNKVYGVLDVWGWELEVGTDSQWWGPGYHGSILMSNNPEPLPMIKLSNGRPLILPWAFKYLGLFKFTGFVTRLEDNRDVPEPYLWGMRMDFKPSPYVEIGLQRTAILGGKGYSAGLGTWWDSFTGKGENSINDPGDQRAGGDIKLTLPFESQPLQLYFDGAGEDESGGLPSNWAFLYGVYLPRVLDFERIGLRAEYTNNHINGKPNVWYRHSTYTSGYTYEGRIIGHHMGTDSEDLFVEASCFIPEINGKISIAYDRKEHNLSDDIREEKQEFYMMAGLDLTEFLRINASYGYGKIKNIGQISGEDENISTFIVRVSYEF